MVKRRKLSAEEKYEKAIHKYTDEHGGPDLIKIDDKYKCRICSAEVPQMGGSICPGCGKDIDWKKYVMG
jgi:rubrerythrin